VRVISKTVPTYASIDCTIQGRRLVSSLERIFPATLHKPYRAIRIARIRNHEHHRSHTSVGRTRSCIIISAKSLPVFSSLYFRFCVGRTRILANRRMGRGKFLVAVSYLGFCFRDVPYSSMQPHCQFFLSVFNFAYSLVCPVRSFHFHVPFFSCQRPPRQTTPQSISTTVGQHTHPRHRLRHPVIHLLQYCHCSIRHSLNDSSANVVDMFFFSWRSCHVLAASFALLHSVYPLSTSSQQTFSSYDYGIDRSNIVKRQSSTPYATTGVSTNGSTPLRLEVRDLEQDPTTWTLYLLGLDMLQYTNQTEMLSWYQITGMDCSLCCTAIADKLPRHPRPSFRSFQ
jgi:hypothetical protein